MTDAEGFPMIRAFTRGRALLPAPDNLVNWERPTNRQYTNALAEITSSNISKQASKREKVKFVISFTECST